VIPARATFVNAADVVEQDLVYVRVPSHARTSRTVLAEVDRVAVVLAGVDRSAGHADALEERGEDGGDLYLAEARYPAHPGVGRALGGSYTEDW
jgi:hypothetical protein